VQLRDITVTLFFYAVILRCFEAYDGEDISPHESSIFGVAISDGVTLFNPCR
jgi:hypothetical protein